MANIKIYQYGKMYKIIWVKTCNTLKDSDIFLDDFGVIDNRNKDIVNDEKLKNNISRAKSKIIEYSLCNDWEYFFTLTIDKNKQDRYNLDAYIRSLGNWIGNYNKKYNTNLKYILVPEWHPKNGGWHCHGLFSGVSQDSLIVNEHGYLDMPYYKNRFGWISMSPIKSREKIAFYITKYVQKDITKRNKEMNKHLFYSSNGLKGKTVVFIEDLPIKEENLAWFYQNDYCGLLWSDSIPQFIDDAYLEKYGE